MSGDGVTSVELRTAWEIGTAFRTPEKGPAPSRVDRFSKLTDSPYIGLADLTPTRPKGSGQDMFLLNSPGLGALAGCMSPALAAISMQSPLRRGASGNNYMLPQTPDTKTALEQAAANGLATPVGKSFDLERLLCSPLVGFTPPGARPPEVEGGHVEAGPLPDLPTDMLAFFNSPCVTNEQRAAFAVAAAATPGALMCDESLGLIPGSIGKARGLHDAWSPPPRPGSASKNHQLLVKHEPGALDDDESPQTRALRSLGGEVSLGGSAERNSSGKKSSSGGRRRSPGMNSQRRLDFGKAAASNLDDKMEAEDGSSGSGQAGPSQNTPVPITPAAAEPSATAKGRIPHAAEAHVVPKALASPPAPVAAKIKGKAKLAQQAPPIPLANMTDPEQAAKAAAQLQVFLQSLEEQMNAKTSEQRPEAKVKEHELPMAAQATPSEAEASERHSSPPGTTGHKRCNCKNSRCLKLYCDCFKAGLFCSECSCTDCQNNTEHIEVVQAAVEQIKQRNPTAFDQKISSDGKKGKQHRTGCNCKKSQCLKRYCECFQAGVACGDSCKCQNCMNQEADREDSAPGTSSAAVKLVPAGLPEAHQKEIQPKLSAKATRSAGKASSDTKQSDVATADLIAQLVARAAQHGVVLPDNMPELQTALAAPPPKGRAKPPAAGQKRGQQLQQQARPPKVPRVETGGSPDGAKKLMQDLLAQLTVQISSAAHPAAAETHNP